MPTPTTNSTPVRAPSTRRRRSRRSIGGPTQFRIGPGGDVYVADLDSGNIWHLGYTAPTGPTLSPVAQHYYDLGGPFSFLGPPVGPEQDIAGGRWQPFLGGAIYSSAATGRPRRARRDPRFLYDSLGGPSSSLGFPNTDETSTLLDTGRFNSFQNGSIYWSPSTGAHEVIGDIRDAWSALGGSSASSASR